MKLKGNKTEQDIREELILSRNAIFNEKESSRLLSALKNEFPNLVTAVVIHWIPEQAEDEVIVMVDDDKMIWLELDRLNKSKPPKIEHLNFQEYERGSRQHLIKMAIAKELAQIELNNAKNN